MEFEGYKFHPIPRGITPGLAEVGKVKIGRKGAERQKTGGNGTYQQPVKLDHFVVTRLDRDQTGNFVTDDAIHSMLGAAELKRIPIELYFDAIEGNLFSRFACYQGRSLWCSGDGEKAVRKNKTGNVVKRELVNCPCERSDPEYTGNDKCKLCATFSFAIRGANSVGGVWKFRTTSYNSVSAILSALTLIKINTGDVLAGLPLVLTFSKKSTTTPNGTATTIPVVSVEYDGDITKLRKAALQLSQEQAVYRAQLRNVQDQALKLISYENELRDERADIVDELYPDGEAQDQTDAQVKPDAVDTYPAAQAAAAIAEPTEPPRIEPPKRGRPKSGATTKSAAGPAISEAAPSAISVPETPADAAFPETAPAPTPSAPATTEPAAQSPAPTAATASSSKPKFNLF